MILRIAAALLTVSLLAPTPTPDGAISRTPPAHPSLVFHFAVRDGEGRAVRWDPCGQIQLLFNLSNAPAGARHELNEATKVIRRATRLTVRLVGDTSTQPSADYGDIQSAGQWPDVLVAFVQRRDHLLPDEGSSAETTTSWITESDGHDRYVTGEMLINAEQNDLYGDGTDSRPSRVRLFEHELGHLIGLDHVGDRRSIMFPQVLRRTGLTAGDLLGLRELGPADDRGARCPH